MKIPLSFIYLLLTSLHHPCYNFVYKVALPNKMILLYEFFKKPLLETRLDESMHPNSKNNNKAMSNSHLVEREEKKKALLEVEWEEKEKGIVWK